MKLMSWNIHGFVGRDGITDPHRTANVIRRVAPDVTALQEVELRHRGRDILAPLLDEPRSQIVEAPAMGEGDNWYGQALFSRFPIADCTIHDLSVSRYEPRRLIEAVVDTSGGSLRILATHLGLKHRERLRQFEQIRRVISDKPDLPTALCGDFNAWWPFIRIMREVFGYGRRPRRAPPRTYPARWPLLPLDRIEALAPGHVVSAEAVRIDPGASDHLPVVAEIRF